MAGETVQLRRPTDNYGVERAVTDVVDLLTGNRGGMIRLRGYSGDVVSRSGGTAGDVLSSNGYPLNVQSPIGKHIAVLHSSTPEDAAPTTANAVLLVTDDGFEIGFGKSIRIYETAGTDYTEITSADGLLTVGGSGANAGVVSALKYRVREASPGTDYAELSSVDGLLTIGGSGTDAGSLNLSGTGRRITGDLSNATPANRLSFQSSTVNGLTAVDFLPNGTGTISGIVAHGGSNPAASAYVDFLQLATEARIYNGHTGAAYLPFSIYTSNVRRLRILTTGEVELGTTPAAAGWLRGPNNNGIYQRNAANSGDVHAIGVTSGDVIQVGQAGNTMTLLGTVLTSAADPPVNSAQVTGYSQCKAYVYHDVAGGGAVGGGGGSGYNYNISGVTKNAVGDFTVTIDRDFAGAAYAVVVTVQDNAANLIARVNGQAVGSFDVHFRTTGGALADPDGFSCVCFGDLS